MGSPGQTAFVSFVQDIFQKVASFPPVLFSFQIIH